MVAVDFDPYREWLDIPPADQPPNYYRLLGLSLFENDCAAIARGGTAQCGRAHLFRFRAQSRRGTLAQAN